MQLVSSRIWTRIAVSISYDNNHYTTGTSMKVTVIRIEIGVLRTVNKGLELGQKELEIRRQVETTQTTALLRLASVLRKVLKNFKDLITHRKAIKSVNRNKIYGTWKWRNTYCNRCARINTGTRKLRNKCTSFDHPEYCIIKIGQKSEKSPGDLRRLAATQTPVADHKLTLVWKTLKGVKKEIIIWYDMTIYIYIYIYIYIAI